MRLGGVVVLMLAVACADEAPGNSTSVDFATGTMDAATVTDAALDAPLVRDARVVASGLGCPATWSECAAPAWRVIAQATQFGRDAHFRALASDLVLVQGGDAAWRVLQIGPDLTPGTPSFTRRFAFPAGNWDVRGLARTEGVAVIVCGPRCALLEASLGDSALHETAGAQLREGFRVNGLTFADGTLCVFGSDVSCLRGGRWQTALDAGDEVISLAPGSTRSVALTLSGRVFASSTNGAWGEEAPVAMQSSVNVAGRRALFHGPYEWLERTDGVDHACDVPDGIAAVSITPAQTPIIYTTRGDVLGVQGDGFCRSQQVQGTVIAASSGACGGTPRVLTDSQLIGDNRCDLE